MECQSTAVLGAAPAGVATADMSASPPGVGWPRFSREERPQGSQPTFVGRDVVRGGTHLLSAPLPGGLRLLPDPAAAAPWAALARGCPRLLGVRGREGNGVTTFRRRTGVVGVASLRRGLAICAEGVRSLRT